MTPCAATPVNLRACKNACAGHGWVECLRRLMHVRYEYAWVRVCVGARERVWVRAGVGARARVALTGEASRSRRVPSTHSVTSTLLVECSVITWHDPRNVRTLDG
eukprot:6184602-Pleurochrysis_carterae.AAC.1